MKVLLQQPETSKFMQRPSEWTDQMENARAFGGLTEALFYCYNHGLHNVELLLESDEDPRMNCKMALPEP